MIRLNGLELYEIELTEKDFSTSSAPSLCTGEWEDEYLSPTEDKDDVRCSIGHAGTLSDTPGPSKNMLANDERHKQRIRYAYVQAKLQTHNLCVTFAAAAHMSAHILPATSVSNT